MIESCSDLLHCEAILAQALNQVRLIGELPYTPADLKHLAGLIRARIASSLHEGTDFLAREAPTCLACFLVWTGVESYQGNTYWPAVEASVGLEGPTWQTRWGRIFLRFLRVRNLPTFDIEGSTAYVTPILGHGGIPSSCLPEYFEKVLEPLVLRDLADPEDPDAIRYELKVRREDEAECARIAAEKAELEERVLRLREQIREREARLAALKDVRCLLELEAQVRDMTIPAGLPTDFAAFCQECESQLQSLEASQREADDRRNECERLVAAFDEADRRVISSADMFWEVKGRYAEHLIHQAAALTLEADQSALAEHLHNQAQAILTTDWQESFGALLDAVSFAQLKQAIERCAGLNTRRAELMLALEAADLEAIREQMRRKPPRSAVVRFLAFVLAVFHRKSLRRTEQIRRQMQADRQKALRNELDRVTEELVCERQAISNMLTGLPIVSHYLTAPNAVLYDTLIDLSATYRKWLEGEEHRQSLCLEQAEIEAELGKLCAVFGISITADSEVTISLLETRLRTAEQRKLAAERAQSVLLSEVKPRLKALAAEKASIERRLYEVREQLSEIGGGSLEAGSALVAQAQTLRQEASTLRAELRRRYPDLSALERAACANFEEAEAQLATEMDQLRMQVNEIAVAIKACEDRRSQIPGVWSAVDEPIRRYLLYGGESAEQFLINSVALYLLYTGRRGRKAISVDLPERVLNAFDAWYQQPREEPMPRSSGEPREQSGPDTIGPLVYYDPIAQEIMVRAPTYSDRHWDISSRAELELTRTDARTQQPVIPLRMYRRPDGLVETEAREFPLPFPAERYALRLKSRGQIVREWVWDGTANRQHLIFDGASGRLLSGHELPRERAYLVVNTAFRVEPESCVFETVPLYGPWHEFAVHTLDPADLSFVTLAHKLEPAQSYSIPVALEVLPVLEPLGGHLLEGITSDGQPVYAVAPEEIRIPLRCETELRLWHLSLTQHTDQPRKTIHMRVSELEASGAVELVNGYASIRLSHSALLGSGVAGDFVVRLRRPPFRDWRAAFTVLPGLAVQFDRAVYAPYLPGKAPSAQAVITLSDANRLSVSPPARLIQSDGPHHCVQASLCDDFVRVAVMIGDRDLPLTIALPKTYWRFQGLTDPSAALWRDQIEEEEKWLGDWQGLAELFLVAELPPAVSGSLILSLDGVMARTDRRPLRRGKARFNVLAFRDALRSGSAVRELKLSLEQAHSAFPPVSLLKVRWQWEVVAVECLQESKGPKTILTVTWQERGKTEGHTRVVRLWRSGYPAERPVAEKIVDDDAYRVQLEIDSIQAPPGEYLLQFALHDPWASNLPQHPEPGATNCHAIVIVRKEEICEGCLIGIRAVRLSPGSRFATSDSLEPGLYRIRIVGRIINKELPPVPNADGVLVTRLNEGWYVGNVEVRPGCGLDGEARAANPVKFEYDVAAREVTAIEDRGGDGAMYCRQCRRLFWSQETLLSEQRRKHALFGPVEHFEVEWL